MKDITAISLPLSPGQAQELRAGQQLRLSGPCYTLRDASINRLATAAAAAVVSNRGSDSKTDPLAAAVIDTLADQLVFFAGPSPQHPQTPDLPFGSIGPTTAARMDTAQISLMPQGLRFSMGKGDRSDSYRQAAQREKAVYLAAIGGAAALLARHVVSSEVVAWPELGTEAVMKLQLKDFPAVVAIDSTGHDVFESAKADSCSSQHLAASKLAPPYAGSLITFEGGEGAGKSTQIKLLARTLEQAGHQVLTLREPGSSTISESIRNILLDTANDALTDRAELLLYQAARAQLVSEVIKPALEAGTIVLCDRFFDSSTAYQGYARGLDIRQVEDLNLFATAGIVPNLTFVLDLPPEAGLARAAKTGSPDRLESERLDFHQRVRDGFLALAARYPHRVYTLDALQEPTIIAAQISDLVAEKDILR
ncbi:MAG: dTMP kinase [Coriobacteriia bacterium]|nr:dTMP kinase [Coriobacteriia bacterium]